MQLICIHSKSAYFRHTPKITFSSCYNKLSVGNFGLKLHRHILGTPKTNITSCKKGHNWCPLKCLSQSTATHHVVSRKKLLQKLRLLVHDCLNDELIIPRDVEDWATGSRIGQLDQWFVTERILKAITDLDTHKQTPMNLAWVIR